IAKKFTEKNSSKEQVAKLVKFPGSTVSLSSFSIAYSAAEQESKLTSFLSRMVTPNIVAIKHFQPKNFS
ncbi:hypothetical protein AB9K17_23670, partial [Salmonella enterica subsp. enterica serovar Kentucky]|uniref:hypothetical protein n=1 Tax=Salmonella enterica TaxID=28901 RepID=UPI003F4BFAD6